ncbi:hypothetical protein KZP23_07545 [Echinicola marina]|uniref:hypothetical protein n=1 Tax=Echinicola marina TaxID=2859768 RepID=UPI001CF6E311|nr:hypothetical protein [Echinicola marina]UCS94854.1 hypothetical protein KZP23_07545 [Echinicola marina]
MFGFGTKQKIEDLSDRALKEKQAYHLERIDNNLKFLSDVVLVVLVLGILAGIYLFLKP